MSLRTRKNRGIEYWVFTGGRENELHLGPVNDISKINSERVLEALDYVKVRYSHYSEIEDKLVSFLPPEKKDQYLSKRIEELYKMADKHISSLSDTELKRQYSGDRTKVRPPQIQKLAPQSFSPTAAAIAASPEREEIEKGKEKNSKKKETKK